MPADLITAPRWTAEELGLPLPDDRHAVSACLPMWAHNIGYEEGDAAVVDQLQAAYPRFCLHPAIREFCQQRFGGVDRGLPFVSAAAAERAAAYVRSRGGDVAGVQHTSDGWSGVQVVAADFPLLKQYWQHAGEILSSRGAEELMAGRPVTCSEIPERTAVRSQVAQLQQVDADSVFLFPSGMAAIAATWRAVRQQQDAATCQFGFPYVDTLKIQERFPGTSHYFFPLGTAAELDALETRCRQETIAAVFCETPTNPLLETPDLPRLRQLADAYGFVLVVDDTLGACLNLNVLPFADVVVTSLTKYFSGYGNVLAGSLVLTPHSRFRQPLQEALQAEFSETLSDVDVRVLQANSADLNERVAVINSNARQLAGLLRDHPLVDSVYYPDSESPAWQAIARPGSGRGGLLSIVLKDAATHTPAVFDRLRICKGPNLGTNFTLCCPYTILAHYDELEFAERCGVSRWLLRVSVGTEPFPLLQERFSEALDAVS